MLYWLKYQAMKHLFPIFLIFPFTALFAQKKEGFLDASFKPTSETGRFYAITEKKGDRWYREAYYIPEKSLAKTGWYKDDDCKIPDGVITSYWRIVNNL